MIALDPLFKGCTRPAMFWGIPLVPFFLSVSFFVLGSVLFNLWLMLLLPAVLMVMRKLCESDDAFFRLLGLTVWMRLRHWTGNFRFWNRTCHYAPISLPKKTEV